MVQAIASKLEFTNLSEESSFSSRQVAWRCLRADAGAGAAAAAVREYTTKPLYRPPGASPTDDAVAIWDDGMDSTRQLINHDTQ